MAKTLNSGLLSHMVKTKRGDKSLKEAVEEIGDITPSTLLRIEQEKDPDVQTFLKICSWLEVSPSVFILKNKPHAASEISHLDLLLAEINADENLPKEGKDMISKFVTLVYTANSK